MNTTKDDRFVVEEREDLLARVMWANQWGHFLEEAFDVYMAHRVNYRDLPEYKDRSALEAARKLRPHAAQMKILAYIEELRSALKAAVRRKQMHAIKGGRKKPTATPEK